MHGVRANIALRHRLCGGVVALLAVVAGLPTGVNAIETGWPVFSGQPADVAELSATIRDSAAEAGARQAAADQLVALAPAPAAMTEFEGILRSDPELAGAGGLVVRAVSRSTGVASELTPALAGVLREGPNSARPMVVEALGAIRTRSAAREIVLAMTPDASPELTEACGRALCRLSGRSELGRDPGAWAAWLARVEGLSESDWNAELARAQGGRADAAELARREVTGRYMEALRKLHLSTAVALRPELLAQMLSDSLPEVRRLGAELVTRELGAATRLDDSVSRAAAGMLLMPDAADRASGAALLDQLAPADGDRLILAALERETDPGAASAMLGALSRWPSDAATSAALAWLERPGPAAAPASNAIWSFVRAGLLQDAAVRQRTVLLLRSLMPDRIPPSGAMILAMLGEVQDRDGVAELLMSPDAAVRRAAAEALAPFGRFVDAILAAVEKDAQLFDLGVRALMLHRQTAAGFEAIDHLHAPSLDARRRGLLLLGSLLPSTDLLHVASRVENDAALREALLSNFTSENRVMSERMDPEQLAAIVEGVTRLAQVRLELSRPADALGALDAVTGLEAVADAARWMRLRCIGLVMLDRLEDAEVLNAPIGDWLDALEAVVHWPGALDVLGLIERRFNGALGEEDLRRLRALTNRIVGFSGGTGVEELPGGPIRRGP